MSDSTKVRIAPTLATMARIYGYSRSGGPRSPRFSAYMAIVEDGWGLSSFNPMAGEAAATAVDALIALDAESVAADAAEMLVSHCGWPDPIILAVVVASPGMWTDRLATEVRHRTIADRRAGHGEILLWTGDSHSVDAIRMETMAEAVRTIWTALHGPALTLSAVLRREGLAYALACSTPPSRANPVVAEALEILGDTSSMGDIIAVLYGDAAATALGYTPLGLAHQAGYAWAIERASRLIEDSGAAAALRSKPN